MNRHYANGFTRVMTNDLYDVEKQLQAYDEHLYLMWNPHTGEHLIMDGMTEYAIMKIPQPGWPVLHSGIVGHIRRIHTANGFSAVSQVEESDAAREADNDRKSTELAEDFAKEMYRADRHSVNFSGVGA
ncbi:2,3-dihydroxybenzoate--AMP ligase [Paenibacillus sp. CAU 1782]